MQIIAIGEIGRAIRFSPINPEILFMCKCNKNIKFNRENRDKNKRVVSSTGMSVSKSHFMID